MNIFKAMSLRSNPLMRGRKVIVGAGLRLNHLWMVNGAGLIVRRDALWTTVIGAVVIPVRRRDRIKR